MEWRVVGATAASNWGWLSRVGRKEGNFVDRVVSQLVGLDVTGMM